MEKFFTKLSHANNFQSPNVLQENLYQIFKNYNGVILYFPRPYKNRITSRFLYEAKLALMSKHIHALLLKQNHQSISLIRIFFILFLGPHPAHGVSQVRGLIRAVAARLRQSYSNEGSKQCLQPTPQLTAMPDP